MLNHVLPTGATSRIVDAAGTRIHCVEAGDGPLVVLVRMRVYITDTQGRPLSSRQTVSRRKHLCKSWWNDDWLHRMLAVCQFLADGGPKITIGDTIDDQVVICASPRSWEAPVGIDEPALQRG